MKILKILLILLVPAIGIVGCQKSCLKPGNPTPDATTSSNTNKLTDSGNNTAARVADTGTADTTAVNTSHGNWTAVGSSDMTEGTNIVGSGDDDRDGGDKRRKK